MQTKVCKQCNLEKSIDDYYVQKSGIDGHFNKCKECIKSNVRSNRAKNIDYYLQYDRDRSNRPDRVKARNEYSKTDRGIETANKAKKRWSETNLIKRYASQIVGNAVRDKKLVKDKNCSNCGATNKRLEGHHCDYAKPLEVIWLCSKCHREWHKHNKPINGD